MSRLDGKTVIITGGASGFGKGIATKFVQEGANVVVADLSAEGGNAVVKELGVSATFKQSDVTKREDWEQLLKVATDTFGGLDIVVNNAGTTYPNKPTEKVTDKDFDICFNVNVKSIYLSTNVLLPYFLETGRPGCFLSIASTAAVRPRPGLVWYNASKAAVVSASKAMAVEYGPKQIRFNSVSPVFGSGTGLSSSFLGKPDTEENRAAFVATVPLGRGSTANDVANACCYLASDEASFITGVNLEVDGGRCV
ncbi:4-formylbenzenesulfonate dehydrogenase TsaC1/TsaC2 [Cytospora mali]|uniref:4-formylbenzenesulfonate dehydrogenase TsaC1/TsaC2 n=1 Tax=Cytospora mali TaxID=578113 RepID=A0A194VR79_CYTMA|nr:4-formylbenzenesulfonate dehydrogenase TsaC1/TsaC2 [Valsa mali]